MVKEKIERINELARLAKERELTEEEKAEREALRAEYIAEFRRALRGDEKVDAYCPKCGAACKTYNKFCARCGAKLKGDEEE